MNAIFGIFTNIIYEYMIFYTNQASITNKCQTWIKKAKNEEKMPGIYQQMILHPNYDTYEYNFWHVYSFHI